MSKQHREKPYPLAKLSSENESFQGIYQYRPLLHNYTWKMILESLNTNVHWNAFPHAQILKNTWKMILESQNILECIIRCSDME